MLHKSLQLSGVDLELIPSAMRMARAAQRDWAIKPIARRLVPVAELRRLISENAMALAAASAGSRQRPTAESLTAEVIPLAEACRFLVRNTGSLLKTRRLGSRSLPLWLWGVRREIRRDAFGVILIIGPGNYPLFLPGVQLIQALVAGNAVMLKPGVGGTPAAAALINLIVRAGFDPGLVWLLPESVEAARCAIAAGPDKVLFTGNAGTGEKILQQLAPSLIPATLELSGSDAVVVRADADLDLVTKALVFGFRLNGGATCMAPKRVFVDRRIATELEGRLAKALSPEGSYRLSAELASRLGPCLNRALESGMHFIAGSHHPEEELMGPVVLGGATPDAPILQEDLFAPIVVLVTVADDAEAVLRANDCRFALGASIFSRNHAVARRMAERLNAGVVTINDLIVPTADAHAPFGGRKRSGFGVTRGAEGLLELTAPKVITLTRGRMRPAFDLPHPGDGALFEAYIGVAHGRGLAGRIRSLINFLKSLMNRSKLKAQSGL